MAYKVFSNGDALTGGELNTFLMNQSVISFATTTARDAALPAPVEGQLVWLEDSNKYVYYTGSTWTDLLVPASSGNAIINGAFDIWQRGTSFTPTAAAWTYNADRWDSGRASGTSGSTITRQASGLTGFNFALRFQRNSGDTNTGAQYLVQRLDTATSIPLAGQTVTLSWYARAGANYSPAASALQLFVYSGTGTDQGGFPSTWTGSNTIVNGTSSTLTTSWQRFTNTFAVGSTATQLGFLFQYTGVGTAGANDSYDITGVQLEIGSSATAFKRNANSIQGELAACQRYYIRFNPAAEAAYAMYGMGPSYSSTGTNLQVRLPVTMRVAPTSMDQSAFNQFRLYDGSGTDRTLTSALTLEGVVSTRDMAVMNASSSSLTTSRIYTLSNNNVSSAFIGFSAELQ
jgi:hypothetical protein